MTLTAPAAEGIPGKYVAIGLLILTSIVGGLFIYMGPRAIRKTPGIVHVGIRYSNEMSMAFTQYPSGGPGAKIEFIAPDSTVAYTFEGLKIGRNLVPIGPRILPSGPYTARLSAPGFRTAEVPVIIEGRMLNPPKDAEFAPGTHADYNMVGVRFEPIGDPPN